MKKRYSFSSPPRSPHRPTYRQSKSPVTLTIKQKNACSCSKISLNNQEQLFLAIKQIGQQNASLLLRRFLLYRPSKWSLGAKMVQIFDWVDLSILIQPEDDPVIALYLIEQGSITYQQAIECFKSQFYLKQGLVELFLPEIEEFFVNEMIKVRHYIDCNALHALKENNWELCKRERERYPFPQFKAIRDDNVNLLSKLISEESSFVHNGMTLLDYAEYFKATKCFKFLILNGYHGSLESAIRGGDYEMIQIIQETEKCEYTGMAEVACGFFQNEILEWLLENHPSGIGYAFYESMRVGNEMAAIILVDHGYMPVYLPPHVPMNQSMSLLLYAATHGMYWLINELVKRGVDVNGKDYPSPIKISPLFSAIKLKDLEMAILLLELGANPNFEPCLHYCSHVDLGKMLIKKGARINFVLNEDGCTPLHWKVLTFNYPMIKLLVKSGADISIKNQKGETPLDLFVNSNTKYNDRRGQKLRIKCWRLLGGK